MASTQLSFKANRAGFADVLILAWVRPLESLVHLAVLVECASDIVKVCGIAFDSVFLISAKAGVGRHIWDVRASDEAYLTQVRWKNQSRLQFS